jgi:hypothetical protein
MIPSSVLAVVVDGECLSCGGFSLSETIRFGSLEFIIDCFGDLSLSHRRDGSDATIMGSTCSGPPSPLRAMIGDLKDRGDDRRGGGLNGSLIKFFHKKLTYVPHSKSQTKTPKRK